MKTLRKENRKSEPYLLGHSSCRIEPVDGLACRGLLPLLPHIGGDGRGRRPVRAIRERFPESELHRLRTVLKHLGRRQAAGGKPQLCPLLREGACSIYADRPAVCLGRSSFDVGQCQELERHVIMGSNEGSIFQVPAGPMDDSETEMRTLGRQLIVGTGSTPEACPQGLYRRTTGRVPTGVDES
jgi:hypothetical protein